MNTPLKTIGRPRRLDRDPVEETARLNRNQRKYIEKNRDKQRALHLHRTYGLSWEDYLKLYEEQKGACAICRQELSLYMNTDTPTKHTGYVDHCHTTGKIRGLLCRSCNSGIGGLKDNALLCKLAADYLEKGSN